MQVGRSLTKYTLTAVGLVGSVTADRGRGGGTVAVVGGLAGESSGTLPHAGLPDWTTGPVPLLSRHCPGRCSDSEGLGTYPA